MTVSTVADAVPGSLREAITTANATPGTDKIVFNYQTPGPHVIELAAALPAINEAVNILGNTEPGYKGKPLIGIDGSSAGSTTDGFLLNNHFRSTIRGLAVFGFSDDGIFIKSGGVTKILGNTIRLLPGGTFPSGNGDTGIIISHGPNTTIGGPEKAARNIISANGNAGVDVISAPSTGTRILGNYIGTDKSGTLDFGNNSAGIVVPLEADQSIIQGNLVSGNNADGISIVASNANVIQSNRIGTAKDGKSPLPNNSDGIDFNTGSHNNLVLKNTIAHNGAKGINVVDNGTTENNLSRNSFFSNVGLAIDLGPGGVTPNDPGDGDVRPNGLLNFPVITSTKFANGIAKIQGSLDTAACTIRIEFYRAANDPTNHGEGAKFIGAINVTTDDFNAVPFSFQNREAQNRPNGHRHRHRHFRQHLRIRRQRDHLSASAPAPPKLRASAHPRPPRTIAPMTAKVFVMPKRSILDPQGVAVRDAAHHHGVPEIRSARVGKLIEIEIEGDPDEAKLHALCRDLLSNPVIEDYELVLPR